MSHSARACGDDTTWGTQALHWGEGHGKENGGARKEAGLTDAGSGDSTARQIMQ